MKKRGFTLIEVLVTLVILSIIALLVTPSIINVINNYRLQAYNEQKALILEHANDWSAANISSISTNEGAITYVNLSSLIDGGYIEGDQITNPLDGSAMNGCIVITYSAGKYTTDYSDLSCDDLKSSYLPTFNVVGIDDPVNLIDTVEVNDTYNLSNISVTAVAHDNTTLTVTGPVIFSNDVEVNSISTATVGATYNIVYTAYDEKLDLTNTATIHLSVVDTEGPSINIDNFPGDFIYDRYVTDSSFTLPIPTITDNSCGVDGNDTSVNDCVHTLVYTKTGSFNYNIIGTYPITYTATDSSGNVSVLVFYVRFIRIPALVLTGYSVNATNAYNTTAQVNSTFAIPVGKVTDSIAGTVITATTDVSSIDTSTIGATHLITYTAHMQNSTAVTTATLNVSIIDTIAPVITVNGSSTYDDAVNVEYQSTFNTPTAVVTDNSCGVSGTDTSVNGCSNTLTYNVSGSVDPNTPGYYDLTYTATDSSNNTKTLVITYHVQDNNYPILNVNGHTANYTVYVEVGSTFTAPTSVSATYNGSSINYTVSGSVDSTTLGTYHLTYTTTASNNNTTTLVLTVIVRDTTAPTLSLDGNTSNYTVSTEIYAGQNWVFNPTIVTTDNNTKVTPTVALSSGSYDSSVAGTYSVTYTATDGSNNTKSITATIVISPITNINSIVNGNGITCGGTASGYSNCHPSGQSSKGGCHECTTSLHPLATTSWQALVTVQQTYDSYRNFYGVIQFRVLSYTATTTTIQYRYGFYMVGTKSYWDENDRWSYLNVNGSDIFNTTTYAMRNEANMFTKTSPGTFATPWPPYLSAGSSVCSKTLSWSTSTISRCMTTATYTNGSLVSFTAGLRMLQTEYTYIGYIAIPYSY